MKKKKILKSKRALSAVADPKEGWVGAAPLSLIFAFKLL
jgi:hypothetical protein